MHTASVRVQLGGPAGAPARPSAAELAASAERVVRAARAVRFKPPDAEASDTQASDAARRGVPAAPRTATRDAVARGAVASGDAAAKCEARAARVACCLVHAVLLPVLCAVYALVVLSKCCCAQRVLFGSELDAQSARARRAELARRVALTPDDADAQLDLERAERRACAAERALEADECYDGLGCGFHCCGLVRLWRWWLAYLLCACDDFDDDALRVGECARRARRGVQTALILACLATLCVAVYAVIALVVTASLSAAAT